jgi:hypothetical protein
LSAVHGRRLRHSITTVGYWSAAVFYEERDAAQNPYAASQVESSGLAEVVESRGPEGIGGWLILPLLGLVFTPIACAINLVTQNIPIFTEGHFAQLTDPNFAGYHPLWAPLLILEPIGSVVIATMAIWGLVLMFRKAKAFPSFMVAFYSVNLLFVIIDTVLGFQIPSLANEAAPVLVKQVFQAGIAAAIWIPYMRVSKRVKNTFVN